MPTDLLVITASSGENLNLARRFGEIASRRGLSTDLLDLTTVPLPLFTPRRQAEHGLPSEIPALSARLAAAARWLICTPEYNGSIPPVLSNAIAWLSVADPDFRSLFNGRPVVIATHSGGGGFHVMTALRLQLSYLGAHVVGRQLVSNTARPAQDDSLEDLILRLEQLAPLML